MIDVESTLNPASRVMLSWALLQLEADVTRGHKKTFDEFSDNGLKENAQELVDMVRKVASDTGFPIEYATDRDVAIVMSIIGEQVADISESQESFVRRFVGGNVFVNTEEGAEELDAFARVKLNLLLMFSTLKWFIVKLSGK